MSGTILDAAGRPHPRARGTVRIVSLVPSLTELLLDLGLGAQLVGRTRFCVHPREAVRAVPRMGGTKDVDLGRVRAAAPTHVIVNVDENEKAVADALAGFVPNLVVTDPVQVEDNLSLYALLGHVFDRERQAQALAARLSEQLTANRRERFEPARVLYLIWRRPWMAVGVDTFIARMLASVGLQAVAPASAARYPQVDFGVFGGERFDAVLASSEPYRFADAHLRELRAEPGLAGRPVLRIDGEMTSWYGSRAIAGLRYLREFRGALDAALRSPARA